MTTPHALLLTFNDVSAGVVIKALRELLASTGANAEVLTETERAEAARLEQTLGEFLLVSRDIMQARGEAQTS